MLLLSRGLKLPHRLFTALYRRIISALLHCVKHPVKSCLFLLKAYFLLMLFAFFLAFSFGSFAQDSSLTCPDGGTLRDYGGQMVCSVPAQYGIVWTATRNGRTATGTSSLSAYTNFVDGYKDVVNGTCFNNVTQESGNTVVNSLPPSAADITNATNRQSAFSAAFDAKQTCTVGPQTSNLRIDGVSISPGAPSYQCPPDNSPDFLSMGGTAPDVFCWKPAEIPPCDCSDLTGSNPQGINYFYAANGTYSQANPPNCISRDDNEDFDIPSCNCKLIATKWASSDVNINGTIYQRWQPIPDPNGITGVFTGGQCDESEKVTPPDTPEKCYQLGNGQNFCLEDPNQKCAKIDGIMTCEAGCGTVNGEFFCFENDDPDEPLPDPDDNITDPDTPLYNMIKSDFKDVLGGTESRLDILARLMSDIKTNTTKGDSNLAAKQDVTNRLLKEISDKLDEQGDDEAPTNPQPIYNTDKLEDFVNPNDWAEKNFKTVALAFKDRLLEAPVMQAVQGFFDVALSASCPTWQTTVDMPFGGSFNINIDQLCSDTMNNIWPAIRSIIVLIFSFLAFRVAFTNE